MMHDGWMFGMGWFWILVLILIGVGIWLTARAGIRSGPRSGTPAGRETPEKILKDRFAKGEIDEEEYRARMDALRKGV